MHPDTVERKDQGWLRDQLVALLGKAMSEEKPDHQACAAYAGLLFKILPPVSEQREQSQDSNAAIRAAMQEVQAKAAKAQPITVGKPST